MNKLLPILILLLLTIRVKIRIIILAKTSPLLILSIILSLKKGITWKKDEIIIFKETIGRQIDIINKILWLKKRSIIFNAIPKKYHTGIIILII